MQRYEKYKDSGVDWIGEIPESWGLTAVKNLLAIPITDGPHTTPILYEDGIPFISAEAVKNNRLDFSKKRGFISLKDHNEFCKKYRPKRNDIYMVKSGATTGNIAMVDTDIDFSIWSPLAVFRVSYRLIPKFLFFALQSLYFRKSVELKWSFGTQQNIGMGVLSNLPLVYPNIEEQQTIANFLDDKTAKIDQTIAIKQKEIELLKERRQILIQKAVTKGLDDTVKLKDSGVDWIGKIPEHWKVRKLKSFCTAFGRIGFRGYTTADLVDEGDGAITISPSNIKEMNMEFNSNSYLSWFKYNESPEIKIRENDILIVKTGSTYGKIGIVKNLPQKATINPQLLVLKKIQIKADYLYELLKSEIFQLQVERNVIGSTIPTISETKILGFSVPIPSSEEEINEISDYILNINEKIAKAISIKEQEIEKLKEYKTVLIDQVVTGKVRVSKIN